MSLYPTALPPARPTDDVFPVLLRPSLFHELTFRYPGPVRGPDEVKLADFQVANPAALTLSEMTQPEQDRVFARRCQDAHGACGQLTGAAPLPRRARQRRRLLAHDPRADPLD